MKYSALGRLGDKSGKNSHWKALLLVYAFGYSKVILDKHVTSQLSLKRQMPSGKVKVLLIASFLLWKFATSHLSVFPVV